MNELIGQRQETNKTYDLGGNQRQLVAHIGAIHYRENYSNTAENWKEINLEWEGNRITKAPYELTQDELKLTIRNKKTGEVSTIELLEVGGQSTFARVWGWIKGLFGRPNTPLLGIDVENTRVSFVRIIESGSDPKTAKFKVTGKWTVKAQDADGESLPVETSLIDGILTETLKPDRPVKYPVRIDPTWQVGASTDDCVRQNPGAGTGFGLNTYIFYAGDDDGYYAYLDHVGSAGRFLNVNIPVGATITLANLILTSTSADTSTTVNTRLRAELNVNPATFSTQANFDARTWTSNATHVHWNAIGAWVVDVEYTSPDIGAPIQEVANLGAITHLVVLWDDFEQQSTGGGKYRRAYSYNNSTTKAPKLVITYTVPSSKGGSIATKMVAAGVI